MSFDRKNDGPERCHLQDNRFSQIMEELPANLATGTVEALQKLKMKGETLLAVHQRLPNIPINFQTLADDLRPVRSDLARLLERRNGKRHTRAAFHTHDSSEQSSEDTLDEEVPILYKAALEVMAFQLKPRGPPFGQLHLLRLPRLAFALKLDYRYYGLVNTWQ